MSTSHDSTPNDEQTLTDKQRAFVLGYIKHKFNATRAALEAGYSPATARQQGSRLLSNVDIRRAIDDFLDENSMSAKEVTWRLSRIGRGDIGDVYNQDTGQIDWAKASAEDLTYLVKRVDTRTTRTTSVNAKGEEVDIEVIEDHIELHDPLKALALLGKQYGLFIDKTETKVTGEVTVKAYKNFDPSEWDTDANRPADS